MVIPYWDLNLKTLWREEVEEEEETEEEEGGIFVHFLCPLSFLHM